MQFGCLKHLFFFQNTLFCNTFPEATDNFLVLKILPTVGRYYCTTSNIWMPQRKIGFGFFSCVSHDQTEGKSLIHNILLQLLGHIFSDNVLRWLGWNSHTTPHSHCYRITNPTRIMTVRMPRDFRSLKYCGMSLKFTGSIVKSLFWSKWSMSPYWISCKTVERKAVLIF